jgi:hypothetical protein
MKYPPSPFGQLRFEFAVVLVVTIVSLWLFLTDLKGKLIGIACGLLFSGLEFAWFASTVELPGGQEVIFKPFDKNCRKGQTVMKLLI